MTDDKKIKQLEKLIAEYEKLSKTNKELVNKKINKSAKNP